LYGLNDERHDLLTQRSRDRFNGFHCGMSAAFRSRPEQG
jgi:hypothetical protein